MTERAYDYILIVGHGRSGTNWLLRLLDLSPHTHCRNEPNEIADSPLEQLPSAWLKRERQPELEAGWDDAVRWASTRMGERDHRVSGTKGHVHNLSRRLGLPCVVERRKLRSLVGLVLPSLRSSEWLMPSWLGSRRALEQAVPVLKLVQVPGWAAWVLMNRPRARVFHIVRHPGGFLNSWRNRYLVSRDRDEVATVNRERLREVIEADPAWATRCGAIDRMSVEESELWYWAYACETIHESGAGSPMYELIIYEKLAADPVDVVKLVYGLCGLSWNDAIEVLTRKRTAGSKDIAHAWHHNLSAECRDSAARILQGSMMQDWWD